MTVESTWRSTWNTGERNEKLPFDKEQGLVARHIFVWEAIFKKLMDLKDLYLR